MYRSLFSCFWGVFLLISMGFAQGKLVLIGGGAETQGGWSDAPYIWAIEQSSNHKVAIISSKEENAWLPEYFHSIGASSVHHFLINDSIASQAGWLYDSLMGYDVLFLIGGLQGEDMDRFQESVVDEAIQDKFDEGGVICGVAEGMRILSSVVFSAREGEIYSDEALRNVNSSFMTLQKGSIDLYEGYVYDNQLVEKARLGRLLGFMAQWWENHHEQLTGIGIDEKTALCIDEEGLGRVYGTGAVTVVISDPDVSEFRISGTKPSIDSLKMIQLLEQDAFDLVSWEVFTSAPYVSPSLQEETKDLTILMSGGDILSENLDFLDAFVYGVGEVSDKILVISRPNTPSAEAVKAMLLARNAPSVECINTSASNFNADYIREAIEIANKFLFVDNDPDSLIFFLNQTEGNGDLLNYRIREQGSISGFMGEDSKLAGSSYLVNTQEVWASYDGILTQKPGLGLLQTTTIMPNPYFDPDFYENTASGMPYTMVDQNLAYGISIGQKSFAKYFSDGETTFLQSFGELPLVVMKNRGTTSHLAPTYGGTARNIAGFQEMTLSLVADKPMILGTVSIETEGEETINEIIEEVQAPLMRGDWLSVYPNPVKDRLNIFLYGKQTGTFDFNLIDGQGKTYLSHSQVVDEDTHTIKIPIPNLSPGVYVLQVREQGGTTVHTVQVIR